MRGGRIAAGLFVAVICIAIVAALVVRSSAKRVAPGTVTGDPTDIRLIGVWAADGTDVYNAAGEYVGETLGTSTWPDAPDFPGMLPRYFMFEAPDNPDLVVLDGSVDPAGVRAYIPASPFWGIEPLADDGKHKRFYAKASVQKNHRPWPPRHLRIPFIGYWLSQRFEKERPTTSVDVTVRFRQGLKGKAQFVFRGPFEAGKTYSAENGEPGKLEVSESPDEQGVQGVSLHFTAGAPLQGGLLWAYGLDGRGMRPYCGASKSGQSLDETYRVQGALLKDIGCVTAGEKPRERTWHNVRVVYDRMGRTTNKEEFTKRLGPPGEMAYMEGSFESSEDAVKCLDIVRGRQIRRAADRLIWQDDDDTLDRLDAAGRERVRKIIDGWLAADDMEIRTAGVRVGLMFDTPAFVDRAFECMKDSNVRHDIAYGFQMAAKKLSEDDVRRIGEILMTDAAPECAPTLISALTRCSAGNADALLADCARDQRPWLWRGAMADEGTWRALGPVETWTLELKARRLIAREFDTSKVAADAETIAEAKRILPTLITGQLLRMDSGAFQSALESLYAQCDRETATRAMVDFARRPAGNAFDEGALVYIARCLNLWNGVDIYDLGSDVPAHPSGGYDRDTGALAKAIVAWRDTGEVTPQFPRGYKAQPGDLRVAAMSNTDRTRGCIGLWIASAPLRGRPGRVVVESSDAVLMYHLTPSSAPMSNGKTASHGGHLTILDGNGRHIGSADGHFNIASLPATLSSGRSKWTAVVEAADSPESVLSGTEVFDRWWKRYGPEGVTAAPPQVESTEGAETP